MGVEPIDLRQFREGDDRDRQRVAAQFDHAARTSGFLSISEHGVDPELTTEMLDVTASFFDLDPHEKMAYFVEDRAANRGYAPERSEALAYSLGEQDLPTDLFEAFNAGLELTAADLADPYDAARSDTLFAVGDLLAEWSNDRWRSTLHRVVPPSGTTDGPVRRRSVAWFQQPNWDALIECLPTCADESNPPRYAPLTSGGHLMAKLMGPRLLEPSKVSPRSGDASARPEEQSRDQPLS